METPSVDSQRVFAPHVLRDRVAIITGGGTGIGLATVHEMLRLGARVAICGRNQAKLDAARGELGALREDVLAKTCDIREPAQVEDFVKTVVDTFGRVDILVNNAGGQFP